MATNNIFSFKRFCHYFRLYIAQHGKLFAQCVLAGYVIFSLIFTLVSSMPYSTTDPKHASGFTNIVNSMTSGIILIVLLPLMCIVGSHFMHAMNNSRRRLHTLTIPASALEKYVSFWVIHVACFFIAYFCVVYAADATRTVISKLLYPELAEYITLVQGTKYMPICPSKIFSILIPLTFIQSYFVLGSTVWHRFSFFKTLGCGILGMLLLFFAVRFLAFNLDVKISVVDMPAYTEYLFLVPVLFNWYMGYRRFKEAELVPHM